jgi:hypothetical protein
MPHTSSHHTTIGLALLFLASVSPAPAWGQPKEGYGVGYFVPEAADDPFRRFELAQGLAKKLSEKLGVPVEGMAFKTDADLRKQLAAKRIQFAVLGGFALASRRYGKPLTYATLRSEPKWTLMTKGRTDINALRGKALQFPGLGGLAHGIVEHGLLGGNIDLKQHFKIVESPDLASAITAVKLGQAGVVFAPADTKGLQPLVDQSLPSPAPAFVLLDADLAKEKVALAKEAALAFKPTGAAITGFGGANPIDPGRFAGLARKRTLRMRMVAVPHERFKVVDLMPSRPPKYELHELDDAFELR